MIDVTVKTLDSQNHVFSVEEDITVRQFKEQISPTISIPVEQQRLIFRGRVLQDDKKISEYSVANNTIHVVQRPANQNNTSNDEPPPRPSSQAGNRMGDAGGIFIAADDGTGGGGGRNAIIMGAIGLPTFDVEGAVGGDEGGHPPRRSGAQVRLMVGNQMLNRASNLLQQLEDDDAAVTSATAASSPSSTSSGSESGDQDSPVNEVNVFINDSPMEVDDDAASVERMISQVVNVSSAAALVAAIRQVQTGGPSSNPPPSPAPNQEPVINPSVSGSTSSGTTTTAANNLPASTTNRSTTTNNNPNQQPSPSRRPESPRIRELGTALQDYLALQDRLTPFLRFLQEALRQNRLYTEAGESQSTQFVFDTVSSVLHLLGHSLHAFSEILCDFSLSPEERRLTASSSILVEQSTVVRATIPVAVPAAAAMLANAAAAAQGGGAATASAAASAGGNSQPSTALPSQPGVPAGISISMGPPQPPSSGGGINNNFAAFNPFVQGANGIPGLAISMSAVPGVPVANMGQISGIPVSIPGLPPGLISAANPAWRNPNAPPNNTSNNTTGQQATSNANNAQQQQSQLPNIPVGGGLPPGLQNLGALLGVGGAGGLANVFGAGAGGLQNPFVNFQQSQVGSNNNNNNSTASANVTARAAGQQSTTNSSVGGQSGGTNPLSTANATNGANVGLNGAMLQNLLRNDLNRSQFDLLLPCHNHHSVRPRSSNRTRPAEFRRYVNVEAETSELTAQSGSIAEGEAVEVLIDLLRNSRLFDLLQPMLKDVVLNYLMRGRDPKNPAHVKTCAKGLMKKILPFLDKFSNKVSGANESVDISATYLNILTEFMANLIQKVLGQTSDGDGRFKSEVINSLSNLQKQLIHAFKVCYPNSTNIGLLFVNYVVEQCLDGMSIIFKSQVRQKLIDHLKQIESKVDSAASSSHIVYKETPATAPPAVVAPTQSSGNDASSASSTNNLLSSRCAASFGNASSSSSSTSGIATETSSSGGSTPSKVPCTHPTPPPTTTAPKSSVVTDDVDIDEVLQLPPTMGAVGQQQDNSGTRRGVNSGSASALGHPNQQTDSIVSLVRSLPDEWADTVQQDIRRQLEMPSQQAFSPGYHTLFPRKH